MKKSILNMFSKYTENWFKITFGEPTPVQSEAWPAIANKCHTLVSAPTGTGKTLSSFLVFIDRFKEQARAGILKKELRLIYISPLKSLAGDIRENLHRPLNGILNEEIKAGLKIEKKIYDINIAVRTGDTTTEERRKMIKSPPHILITTPESLYLLITSVSGQGILKTAEAIIIDELHAMIDTKRGAHLMLSLARLDKLCGKHIQRIGLSATIDPLESAAKYLTNSSENVKIIAPKMKKDFKIEVTSPLDDMRRLPNGTIWPDIARAVYNHCEDTRSVIVFVDGRMYAEKIAYYVNQIAGEGFARTHHGCVSKEQRFNAENDLRNGRLRLLCATSSMELGIDVGDIDRVLQIGHPSNISSVMQRLGRAGHNPGRVSVMHMFPRTAPEGLYCGLTAKVANGMGVEKMRPPRLCFDVLAQHLVSMASGDGYSISDVMDILKNAYPFKDVTRDDVKSILCMLAGDYEHKRDIPVRPRILYDRINERVNGDAYSRMLAVSTGGTIPDTGMFSVKSEKGVKLGELDEEFVFEARVGDKFLLGSFAWKIAKMDKDTVVVTQTNPEGAKPPFWRNFWLARKYQTGVAFGKLMREITEAGNEENIIKTLRGFGLDESAAYNSVGFIMRQIEATGVLPDDRTIIVEHFSDEANDNQLMVHSVFGKQINAPLAILLQEAAKRVTYMDVGCYDDNDGILLMANGGREFPEGLLQSINAESVKPVLEAILPSTSIFNMTFRYNAFRAMMMGVRKGKRQPLWVQRLRGAEMLDMIIKIDNHPLIRETKRECLEDYWDLPGLEDVLKGIHSGSIQIREIHRTEPSPMSLPLRRQAEAELLYNYYPTTSGINNAAEEALKELQMIKPAAEQLAKISERKKLPENEMQLHSMLMIEGDFVAGELDIPMEWFESLAKRGRVFYIEPGFWIAAEHFEEYAGALERNDFESRLHITRRVLRYRGAQYPEQIAARYFWKEETAVEILNELCVRKNAVLNDGLYYHADLFERARRETISFRRKQIKTMPPERYASLLANRVRESAPPSEQLEKALKSLCGLPFPPSMWENVILPTRVNSYRPALLDALLSNGTFFWRIIKDKDLFNLSFNLYADIDWEADNSDTIEKIEGDERVILDALIKRGASFSSGLYGLLEEKPADVLLSLTEKGIVHADSFVPVRQLLDKEKTKKYTAKQKANTRVTVMNAGRWDIARPLIILPPEEQLERAFDRAVILCRETARNMDISWTSALEILRVWEYTGRVRRGYFIEGLSGAQFIREKDFMKVILTLENPSSETVWLSAADPCQIWGKYIPHLPGKNFTCVSGTAVALHSGIPVALFERQGNTLRVFDNEILHETLTSFANEFKKRRIFPSLSRILVKEYPKESAETLSKAGFTRIMLDFMLQQDFI